MPCLDHEQKDVSKQGWKTQRTWQVSCSETNIGAGGQPTRGISFALLPSKTTLFPLGLIFFVTLISYWDEVFKKRKVKNK